MALRLVKTSSYTSDQDVVQGLLKNDSKAFDKLYHMSFSQIRQWITQNNGSEQDAEDIFQDAVLAVWKNIKEGKYQKKENVKLSTYVFQICKFRWFEQLKSARVRYSTKLNPEFDVVDANDQEELDSQSERVNYLHRLFHQLGEKCQQILKCYYYQKMSLAEIAAQMDYTPQSAKNEKYRCMQRLKKLHHT